MGDVEPRLHPLIADNAHLPEPDPDAQATVTDFSDFTDTLPSDMVRSLALIRTLDEKYEQAAADVHELTKIYGTLPSCPIETRPDATQLRSRISARLSQAVSAREASLAESSRMQEVVERHYARLESIIGKLEAIPRPETPVEEDPPAAVTSQSQHPRGRKTPLDADGSPPHRIMLRLDGSRTGLAPLQGGSKDLRKIRSRRVTVPGEVLMPPNPNSPPLMTDSEGESIPRSPIPMPTSRIGAPLKESKPPRARPQKHTKDAPKERRIKTPKSRTFKNNNGFPGTNVHSSVAGISTTNALSLLKPPPENAVIGSEDAPWLKLTAWELATLRKRMKKNAVWSPSDTMIARELMILGRGIEAYRKAKADGETAGQPVPLPGGAEHAKAVSEPELAAGSKPLAEGEISANALGKDDIQLSNRGMKLNQAKKLKKESLAKEAAATAAAEAEEAGRRLADAGRGFKNIFTQSPQVPVDNPLVSPSTRDTEKEGKKAPKKRKADAVVEEGIQGEGAVSDAPNAQAKGKKRAREPTNDVALSVSTTTKVPLAAPGASKATSPTTPHPLPLDKKGPYTAPNRRRSSIVPKAKSPELMTMRPRSSGKDTANIAVKETTRRNSSISIKATSPAPTRAASNRKRPAPGIVTANAEGGIAVSVGKRKSAPRKKSEAKKSKAEVEEVEEQPMEYDDEGIPIDPNEPRYCLCFNVSYGTMVLCENKECEREWFHLECVGLLESPKRTSKWYCPDCRKKLGVGEAGAAVNSKPKKK